MTGRTKTIDAVQGVLLVSVAFVAFSVCRLNHDVDPPVFELLHDYPELYIRPEEIQGFAVESRYGGEPCVKILLDGLTIYVLGPPDRIRRLLARQKKPR